MRLATTMTLGGDLAAVGREVADLERAGLDAVWVGESYGVDAPSGLGYLAATTERLQLGAGVLNVFSRSAALLAMTAAGLDAASGGRFVLGLGASGPQLVEGFHGARFRHPVQRLREVVDICRRAWRREPVANEGVLAIPVQGGSGLGRPVKLLVRPVRERVPIYLAGLGARTVELAAEVAEGWLPQFFVPEQAADVWGAALRRGAARRDPHLPGLEVVAGGPVAITDDRDQAARLRDGARPFLALYMGGMGAKGHNFYNDLLRRYGYAAAADEVQDLFLSGKREEAAAALPNELVERTTLIGSTGQVAERIAAYREAGVTCLSVELLGDDKVRTVERLRALMDS